MNFYRSIFCFFLLFIIYTTKAIDPCTIKPNSILTVTVSGETSYEFGYTVGKVTKNQIITRLSSTEVQAVAKYISTDSGAKLFSTLQKNANITYPSFVLELTGLAAGANISYKDAFLLNVIDDIEVVMPPPRAEHCTDVLIGPAIGSTTPRIIMHNEDASLDDAAQMFLLDGDLPRVESDTPRLRFTAFMYAGTLASGAFAYNDAGVFFTTNALFPLTLDDGGVPRNFVHRHVLESLSLADAQEKLTSSRVACGFTMNLGSVGYAGGNDTLKLFNVEMSAAAAPVSVAVGPGDHMYHANSYIHASTPQQNDISSNARLARLAELPIPAPGNITAIALLLGDTFNATYPVYRSGTPPDCCETVVTSLFEVNAEPGANEVGSFSIYANNPHLCPVPILRRQFAPPLPPPPFEWVNTTGNGYSSYCLGIPGACKDPIPSPPGPPVHPGTIFMGGGTDVDEAFNYQIKAAGGGKFLVFSAAYPDDTNYGQYIWGLASNLSVPLQSVHIIILHGPRAGEQEFVLDAVSKAGAIFFMGGSQVHYVNRINEDTIANYLVDFSKRGTIGGTSAGSDYLGHFIFAPPNGAPDVDSPIALADPYAEGIQFNTSIFFNSGFNTSGVRRVLTDAHFVTEDRMGRNLAFLSRLVQDGNISVQDGGCAYLVANDEATALIVDPATGLARIYSDKPTVPGWSISFICSLCVKPATCKAKTPLTAGPFNCERLDASSPGGGTYNFHTWNGNGVKYTLNVVNGTVIGQPYGPPS